MHLCWPGNLRSLRDNTFIYCRKGSTLSQTGPDNDSRSRRQDFDDEVGSTKNVLGREFPGGPELRTWCVHFWGTGLIPGQGTKILQALQCWKKKKKKKKKKKIKKRKERIRKKQKKKVLGS